MLQDEAEIEMQKEREGGERLRDKRKIEVIGKKERERESSKERGKVWEEGERFCIVREFPTERQKAEKQEHPKPK